RALYRSRSRSRLLVLDKENGGKADSLNAAINASRFPLVIAVDADTLVEPAVLCRLTRPFLLGRQIAAVGGTVRVANNCTVTDGRVTDARVPAKAIPGIQVVEYLRAFLFGRLGWNRLGGNLIISGAFGLFKKEYVMAVGGYRTNSIVEDLDLVVRMHRHLRRNKVKYEMPFIPDPVAWTEVPESFKILSRQRERWHRGLISAMWQYKGMLFNPRYGRVGLLALCLATPCRSQTVRVSAWSSYEAVTGSQDWTTLGAQLTATGARGHGGWIAAEVLGRFGETDVTERVGAVVHPTPRLWLTAEAGTARQPVFMPKNTWEVDASALVARRASLGLGYRRWYYGVGPVDGLMPHVTLETTRM